MARKHVKIYANPELQEARVTKFFTQKEMAGRIPLSREHYARIESGKDAVSMEAAKKICKILSRSFTKLFHIYNPNK